MTATRKSIVIAALCALAVIAAGCHKVVGGGWFDGLNGGKAHFAFQAQCEEYQGEDGWYYADFFTGQIQFKDASAGVRFHGEIQFAGGFFSPDPISCKEAGEVLMNDLGEGGIFVGECRTQPGGMEGSFFVTVESHEGGKGWMREDFISVETDCTPDGEVYYNEGVVRGGNVSVPGQMGKSKEAGAQG